MVLGSSWVSVGLHGFNAKLFWQEKQLRSQKILSAELNAIQKLSILKTNRTNETLNFNIERVLHYFIAVKLSHFTPKNTDSRLKN